MLCEQASIVADTARDISLEEHDGAGSDLQFWADTARACIDGHRRDLDAEHAGALNHRLEALEDVSRSMALSMEFDFLVDPDRLLLSIGYQVLRKRAGPELLRPAGLRSAAGQLHRHRQGRRAGAALVPPEPRRAACGGRARR